MKYVKSCLIITMLAGIGYSQDCDPDYWNCDCNEDSWQEYYNSEGHNMQGCYLYEADLIDANLQGANLDDAGFGWALLTGANLQEVYGTMGFYYANFTGANLASVDLSRTFFVQATLDGTIFDGADLTYAYFDENLDYYEDASYDAGAESGDLNLDGVDNVLDVVILVNNILTP